MGVDGHHRRNRTTTKTPVFSTDVSSTSVNLTSSFNTFSGFNVNYETTTLDNDGGSRTIIQKAVGDDAYKEIGTAMSYVKTIKPSEAVNGVTPGKVNAGLEAKRDVHTAQENQLKTARNVVMPAVAGAQKQIAENFDSPFAAQAAFNTLKGTQDGDLTSRYLADMATSGNHALKFINTTTDIVPELTKMSPKEAQILLAQARRNMIHSAQQAQEKTRGSTSPNVKGADPEKLPVQAQNITEQEFTDLFLGENLEEVETISKVEAALEDADEHLTIAENRQPEAAQTAFKEGDIVKATIATGNAATATREIQKNAEPFVIEKAGIDVPKTKTLQTDQSKTYNEIVYQSSSSLPDVSPVNLTLRSDEIGSQQEFSITVAEGPKIARATTKEAEESSPTYNNEPPRLMIEQQEVVTTTSFNMQVRPV